MKIIVAIAIILCSIVVQAKDFKNTKEYISKYEVRDNARHKIMLDFSNNYYDNFLYDILKKSERNRLYQQNNLELKFMDLVENMCIKSNIGCDYLWTIIFVRNTQENAFAIYNGTLLFEYNFFNKMTEEEILFVMVHELSHVLLRHSLEEFILEQEILNEKLVTGIFDPQIVAENISLRMFPPEKIKDLIERQELEADSLALIILSENGININLAANFILKLKEDKTIFVHSNVKDRKINILKILNELAIREN